MEGLPREAGFCARCLNRLELPQQGVRGTAPLAFPWWAAGPYAGALRSVLLDLKRRPRQAVVDALLGALRNDPVVGGDALLTPIPSWKQRGNGLPAVMGERLARKLGLAQANLLEHRHPVLGQHRLRRRLREANQRGAFLCRDGPAGRRREVILLDDILTSGATLLSAADALQAAGWRVRGAVCLARTVRPGERDRGP
jgi:predicted amidophosphoribosyltransferase